MAERQDSTMSTGSSLRQDSSSGATHVTLSKLVVDFATFLKTITDRSSVDVAVRTVELLRDACSQRRWGTAREVMAILREIGKELDSIRPTVPITGNMVRRVLRLAREVYAGCANSHVTDEDADGFSGLSTTASLADLLLAPAEKTDFATMYKTFKGLFMQAISDLLEELEESKHNIAIQALEHIHADEVIMTYGCSRAVEAFLLKAAALRTFQVIAVECAPSFQGQDLALRLAAGGIETTVITDSAVFAMLARVNKVIIGTNAVLADGGLLAMNGVHGLCLAARHHSVPVIVLAPLFKLTPSYLASSDGDSFNNLLQPALILPYGKAHVAAQTSVLHPLLDYVPPHLVSLFLSNLGGSAPSYIYRLISEYYHEDDFDL